MQFYIITDHKPLTFALNTNSTTGKTSRLSQFNTDIRHVKGTLNVVADALSTNAINPFASMQ
jgi:hypothetical protein